MPRFINHSKEVIKEQKRSELKKSLKRFSVALLRFIAFCGAIVLICSGLILFLWVFGSAF